MKYFLTFFLFALFNFSHELEAKPHDWKCVSSTNDAGSGQPNETVPEGATFETLNDKPYEGDADVHLFEITNNVNQIWVEFVVDFQFIENGYLYIVSSGQGAIEHLVTELKTNIFATRLQKIHIESSTVVSDIITIVEEESNESFILQPF